MRRVRARHALSRSCDGQGPADQVPGRMQPVTPREDDSFTCWETDNEHIGRRVEVYDQLESTNTVGLQTQPRPRHRRAGAVGPRGELAGRGQYGRQWQAPPGSSVLMSLILFPPPALARPGMLTAWAAVSVSNWPASLRINAHQMAQRRAGESAAGAKKICGILIEQRRGPRRTMPRPPSSASASMFGNRTAISPRPSCRWPARSFQQPAECSKASPSPGNSWPRSIATMRQSAGRSRDPGIILDPSRGASRPPGIPGTGWRLREGAVLAMSFQRLN